MEKEAIAEWSRMLSLNGAEKGAAQVVATANTEGFGLAVRALARENLEQLQARLAKGEYVPASACALAALRAGEKEQALEWLQKAAGEHNRFALEIVVNPLFDPLRSEPRFQEIVGKIIPGNPRSVGQRRPCHNRLGGRSSATPVSQELDSPAVAYDMSERPAELVRFPRLAPDRERENAVSPNEKGRR